MKAIGNSIIIDPEFKSSLYDWATPSLPVLPVMNFKILWRCLDCKHSRSSRYLPNQFSDRGLPFPPKKNHTHTQCTYVVDEQGCADNANDLTHFIDITCVCSVKMSECTRTEGLTLGLDSKSYILYVVK